ncbi:MFS transporter [Arthrobacter sp. zg-Y20]|uniref:MFS transporter n=1 Tax=unclassified Arthrobacter TaxID=235627 RepID=UPI001D141A32|nr:MULTISPECIES: MFS transporter [unclassified Arthrobacter]MCC3277470.1 MFS transporter [Arthrobacter sp. zg-Y20]MDK1317631.1 MFS transporter [Arthrobacter sp. zg.Y20]WIB05156.1 MFS transporter [Arthrobacter sp. zg-Y20]
MTHNSSSSDPSHPGAAKPVPAPETGRYQAIFALAGRSFFTIGFLARLPLAMLTVGALTLITEVSGSYALGGFAAGGVGIGSATGAPLLGYLADRIGQRPVLLSTAVLNPVAIGLFLLSAALLEPSGAAFWMLAAAFFMGASCPQVGPMARVRWMAMTAGRPQGREMDTALSYEGTADELTFVLGPALVGLLAAAVAPWLPLALAAVLTAGMVSAFAVHRTVESVVPASRRPASRKGNAAAPAGAAASTAPGVTRPKTQWLVIMLPVLGMVAMGTFFGSTQTSLTAFAGSFGVASSAGLLYAVMGLSSAVAALSVAFWPERFGPAARWMLCAAAMTAFSLLLFLPADIATMLVVLLVLGIPVGPTMVSIFGIGAIVAPRELMGTVMTMLASGVVTGTALGSAVSGRLADSFGYGHAFIVPTAAAATLLLLSLVASRAAAARRKAAA